MNKIELPLQPPGTVDVRQLQRALEDKIAGEVRFDRLSRGLYATDASVYQIVPFGIVVPKSEQDVLATLAVCSALGVPITARGGGTSQAGQCIGPGIVLDFSRFFDRILEVNAAERWARVEPGVVLDDLNRHVKPLGLQFAPDISTSNRATIGGMVANNSSGTHSVIHGKTIDHVLGLKVALADSTVITTGPLSESEVEAKCQQVDLEGSCYRIARRLGRQHAAEIERRFPKILRRVGGYNFDLLTPGQPFDLTKLFIGSEGTLGITLEAKVRLIELPRARAVMVLHFAGLLDALEATPWILQHGPAAVEVLDKFILDSTLLNAESQRLRDFLIGDPGGVLFVEFYADLPDQLPARLAALETDLRGRGYTGAIVRAADLPLQERIWKLRKFALGLSMAEKGDAKAISFVEDTAVAPERLRDYIAEFLDKIQAQGTTAGVYAHASVGCLHVRPVINLKTEIGVRQFETLAEEVADLVLKYGGALSGEHGDGLVRSPFMEKMFGPTLYQAFRELKYTFDPRRILNPGKIVDAPPLTSQFRYGQQYVTPEVATTFDFSVEGGLTRAAELCAGVGECRKKRQGTMCPSYQATCEEAHSTRGRANILRLALTGQMGLEGLTDPAVKDALDLCLECKACKSECPTNVDMARLKAEFLDQYYRKHGLPWRSRIFGNVATLSRWGSRFAPLSNWIARSGVVRTVNDWLFAIDRRRIPPAFTKERLPPAPNTDGPEVLVFPDTFARYHEPALARAAFDVLAMAGCAPRWEVPGQATLRCCGRPQISNGLLQQAVGLARHNVDVLFPWASSGKPIVACEPSCILTIKDDYPALVGAASHAKARVVADACLTMEEWLEVALAKAPVKFTGGARRLAVQAHCHQRSLVGSGPMLKLLRRIPGVEVIDLDAGCCGLAGSFGYEKEHYEVSRLVGEQRLFPALRKLSPETVVVAPGFSCRLQIAHFTGLKALHPLEVLRAVEWHRESLP